MTSKDTHDPGWNDPPIFTYDKAAAIQTAATNKKGTLLNKRVAFPMGGGIGAGQGTTAPNHDASNPPPKMQSIPVMPVNPMPCVTPPESSAKAVEQNADTMTVDKDRIDEVLKNLQLDTNLSEEIVKRIRVMEKMWNEDKLDGTVRYRMLKLSEALFKGDADEADHIQKSLMVDKISQCSSWMSGIRQLINQKRVEKS